MISKKNQREWSVSLLIVDIRPMHPEEQKYAYKQSQQLKMQCGGIGCLRGDFGKNGNSFHSTWEDISGRSKDEAFKAEFDEVVNTLRNGVLKNRAAMRGYCGKLPESRMPNSLNIEYGFRADTKNHTYLIRCNPQQGEYNFYIYAYKSSSLDRNIEHAKNGIRFINSGYTELFRIKDGESISIFTSDGKQLTRTCRYIDDTHLEVGSNLYHICEFAERMEECGNTYAPVEKNEPGNETKKEKKNRNDIER